MTALPSASGLSVEATAGRAPGRHGVGAAGRVLPALAEASRRTGVPFDALFHTARIESGFDPEARARTSSATGLFQFTDSTWLQTLAKHGSRHGLVPGSRAEALGLRRDPYAASLMAAHHMADNAALLAERTGRSPGQVDLYLAHFLGAGGAADFLRQMEAAPGRPADELMPAAARANRSIFYAGGRPRSLSEVYELFARKLGSAGAPAAPAEGALAPGAGAVGPVLEDAAPSGELPQQAVLTSARLAYLLLADLGA